MKTINYGGQGARVRVRGKKALSLIIIIFCLMTGSAWAAGEQVADYTAYPPFLPRVVSPNIMFLLDYSASMVKPAYGSCLEVSNGTADRDGWFSNCGTPTTISPALGTRSFYLPNYDYDPSAPYSGYFDNGFTSNANSWCKSLSTYGDWCSPKYNCTAASNGICSKGTAANPGEWNGNFLNWLTATQFDILKKTVVGGDVNPAPEQSAPVTVRSILTDGVSIRKTVDYGYVGSRTQTSSNCYSRTDGCTTPWPSVTPNWLTPTGSSTAIFGVGKAGDNGKVLTLQTRAAALPSDFSINYKGFVMPGGSAFYVSLYGYTYFYDSSWSKYFYHLPYYHINDSYYYDDLDPSTYDYSYGVRVVEAKGSKIHTFVKGTAPNRIFVISFDNVFLLEDYDAAVGIDSYDHPISFQIQIYEGSGHTVYVYQNAQEGWDHGGGRYTYIYHFGYDGTTYNTKYWDISWVNSPVISSATAFFASPYMSYDITPRGSPTDFQPAVPFNFPPSGANPAGYKVEININEVSSGSNCAAGSYYNGDRNKCYDHESVGLLQDLRDGELSGTLGFRLAIMQLNPLNGGTVTKHFNQKDGMGTGAGGAAPGWPSLMNDTRKQAPTAQTPLAEALYEAEGYFKEDTSFEFATNDWSDAGAGTCPTTGTNYDPYCFQSAGRLISCCKSFVLLVSSGNYSHDFQRNIYYDTALDTDLNPTTRSAGWSSTDDGGSEGTKTNEGWLDNVAYKARVPGTPPDLRPGIAGDQNLTVYAVNTFGAAQTNLTSDTASTSPIYIYVSSTKGFLPSGKLQIDDEIMSYSWKTSTYFYVNARGLDSTTAASHLKNRKVYQAPVPAGANILKKAARYGGFDDSIGDTPDTYDSGEDDRNGDGEPDTYFAASAGSDIKAQIIAAVTNILKSSASGTTVSVLSTSASGEGAIYQAYFYPAKIENVTEERTWPGYMRGFFLDEFQNLRDDASGGSYTCGTETCTYSGTPDGKLIMANSDKIARMCLNTDTNAVRVKMLADADGDGQPDITPSTDCPGTDPNVSMDEVTTIWEAGKKLAKRDKSTRSIYTWADLNGDGAVTTTDSVFDNTGETRLFTTDNKDTLRPYLCAGNATCVASGDEAENIINFVRGNAVTGYRNRCITISGATTEAGCAGSNQRVWALGDIVYSTPTLVSGPGEKYDEIYSDSTYRTFRDRYANRRSVIYAGGNDGMLHAFNGGVYKTGDDPATASVIESGRFIANASSSVNGFANGWNSSIELGDELWAFVPHDNLPHLAWLACNGTATDPSNCGGAEYTHVYYVDQRPKVTDVRIFDDDTDHPGGWGTILIMGMRFGGGAMDVDLNADGDTADAGEKSFRSAFYVFDITNPEKPPTLLFRFYNQDLGFTTSYPAIAKVCSDPSTTENCRNTEKWYMVVGSGPKNEPGTGTNHRDYNGTHTPTQDGKIFVVELKVHDDGTLLKKTFTVDGNTFMGDPTVVDADINFTSDVIYIGSAASTTSGKVYRINTMSVLGVFPDNSVDQYNCTNWCISTLIAPGKPLLVGPSVSKDSQGNIWVFFGTGRLRSTVDLSNYDQQAFYGIKDGCWRGGGNTRVADVNSSNIVTPASSDTACPVTYDTDNLLNASNVEVRSATGSSQVEGIGSEEISYIGSTACTTTSTEGCSLLGTARVANGWYLNLSAPTPPATMPPSERVLSKSVVLGGLVMFTTYKPTSEMCSIFGDSTLYTLYYESGTAYISPTMPEGGTYTRSGTEYVSKSMSLGKGMPTAVGVAIGKKTVSGFVQKSTGEIVRVEAKPGLSVRSGTASWREKTGGGGTSEIETIYKHIVR